jgi:small-conductance mechanosensitive channel
VPYVLSERNSKSIGAYVSGGEFTMRQIRTWSLVFVMVILHLGLTYIDLRNEPDGLASIATGTVLMFACLSVVRISTQANTVGDLLDWCRTRWRWTAVWAVATSVMAIQLVWIVNKSPVSAVHGVSSTMFIGAFFAACGTFCAWIFVGIPRAWRRIAQGFRAGS